MLMHAMPFRKSATLAHTGTETLTRKMELKIVDMISPCITGSSRRRYTTSLSAICSSTSCARAVATLSVETVRSHFGCFRVATSIKFLWIHDYYSTHLDSSVVTGHGRIRHAARPHPKYFKCYVPTPRAAASTIKHLEFMFKL